MRPDPVPKRDPNGDYLQRVWNSSVYPLAQRLKIRMKLPPVQPRSRQAHEAAHWARRQGRFMEYNKAVFRAFFEDGEDIEKVEVLIRLASQVGLESDSLREALERKEYLPAVLADEREAEELGIHGVPAFIANRKAALSGVQSVESLLRLIEQGRLPR